MSKFESIITSEINQTAETPNSFNCLVSDEEGFLRLHHKLSGLGSGTVPFRWIDGEDLAQSAYLKLLERETQGVVVAAVPYLHTSVVNARNDIGRRNQIIEWMRYEGNPEADQKHERSLGMELSPEEYVLQREAFRELKSHWLKFITEEEFELLAKYFVSEVPISQLSEQFGITSTALKARIYRAKEKVKVSYKDEEVNPEFCLPNSDGILINLVVTQQQALIMRNSGSSYEEIAKKLGLPSRTAAKELYLRAKRKYEKLASEMHA